MICVLRPMCGRYKDSGTSPGVNQDNVLMGIVHLERHAPGVDQNPVLVNIVCLERRTMLCVSLQEHEHKYPCDQDVSFERLMRLRDVQGNLDSQRYVKIFFKRVDFGGHAGSCESSLEDDRLAVSTKRCRWDSYFVIILSLIDSRTWFTFLRCFVPMQLGPTVMTK